MIYYTNTTTNFFYSFVCFSEPAIPNVPIGFNGNEEQSTISNTASEESGFSCTMLPLSMSTAPSEHPQSQQSEGTMANILSFPYLESAQLGTVHQQQVDADTPDLFVDNILESHSLSSEFGDMARQISFDQNSFYSEYVSEQFANTESLNLNDDVFFGITGEQLDGNIDIDVNSGQENTSTNVIHETLDINALSDLILSEQLPDDLLDENYGNYNALEHCLLANSNPNGSDQTDAILWDLGDSGTSQVQTLGSTSEFTLGLQTCDDGSFYQQPANVETVEDGGSFYQEFVNVGTIGDQPFLSQSPNSGAMEHLESEFIPIGVGDNQPTAVTLLSENQYLNPGAVHSNAVGGSIESPTADIPTDIFCDTFEGRQILSGGKNVPCGSVGTESEEITHHNESLHDIAPSKRKNKRRRVVPRVDAKQKRKMIEMPVVFPPRKASTSDCDGVHADSARGLKTPLPIQQYSDNIYICPFDLEKDKKNGFETHNYKSAKEVEVSTQRNIAYSLKRKCMDNYNEANTKVKNMLASNSQGKMKSSEKESYCNPALMNTKTVRDLLEKTGCESRTREDEPKLLVGRPASLRRKKVIMNAKLFCASVNLFISFLDSIEKLLLHLTSHEIGEDKTLLMKS